MERVQGRQGERVAEGVVGRLRGVGPAKPVHTRNTLPLGVSRAQMTSDSYP